MQLEALQKMEERYGDDPHLLFEAQFLLVVHELMRNSGCCEECIDKVHSSRVDVSL